MSEAERKIADTPGQIMLAAKEDRPLSDATWKSGRILLSNKRLILATSEDKNSIPLTVIRQIGGRIDASIDARQVADYVTIKLPKDTYLVSANDHDAFELSLFRALLHGSTFLVKHPAVEGGVVTNVDWEQATLTLDEDGIAMALKSGQFVSMVLEEMSGLRADVQTVRDDKRLVIAASHLDKDGTIVETHLAAGMPKGEHLRTYLRNGMSLTETNVELSETERAVLMALYSGVSPFDIPSFLDRDVDHVEEIYERLLDVDLLDKVRTRCEVRLNARGRNIADSVSENQ